MRKVMRLNVALASLSAAACVTINVYFPAAAAEKAADQIIDTVTSRGVALPLQPASPGGASGAPPVAVPSPAAPPLFWASAACGGKDLLRE